MKSSGMIKIAEQREPVLHGLERRFPNRRVGKTGNDRADLEIGAPLRVQRFNVPSASCWHFLQSTNNSRPQDAGGTLIHEPHL